MTYIIDAHQDIAYNALSFQRGYSTLGSANPPKGTRDEHPCYVESGQCQRLAGPEYQSGQIAVIFATLWIPPWQYRGGDWDTLAYQSSKQAGIVYRKQVDYYRRLCDENPEMFKLILNRSDLSDVLTFYDGRSGPEKETGRSGDAHGRRRRFIRP